MLCRYYHRFGHIESYYWKNIHEHANTARVDHVNLFLSSIDSLTDRNNIWFLDCACSNHMAHDRRLFQSIMISNTNEVRMGDPRLKKLKALEKLRFRQGLDKITYLRMFIMFQSLPIIS